MSDTLKLERRTLWLLAALQLTLLLDFMILMPLGPELMRAFGISAAHFGALVSAYTLASAAMGVIGVLWIDRFERRLLLLLLYAAFIVATVGCAVASSPLLLLAARVLAGAAAGLLWAVVMALIVELVPESRRGSAIGLVMSSYAVAAVAGVPLGLWLSGWLGFRAPFWLIAALSGLLWLAAWRGVPSARGPALAARHTGGLEGLRELLRTPALPLGWLLTFCVVSAGFLLIPYLAAFMVGTLGLGQRELSLVYLCAGAVTLFSSRLVGSLVDRFGPFKLLAALLIATAVPHLAFTRLASASLVGVVLLFVLFMTLTSGRMIPTMVLVSSRVPGRLRGRYLAMNTAASDAAAGLATWLGGMLVTRQADGALRGFERSGVLAVMTSAVALLVLWRIYRVDGANCDATELPAVTSSDGAA